MGKIEKIQKKVNGSPSTVYPKTLSNAVYNPDSGKTVKEELSELEVKNISVKDDILTIEKIDGTTLEFKGGSDDELIEKLYGIHINVSPEPTEIKNNQSIRIYSKDNVWHWWANGKSFIYDVEAYRGATITLKDYSGNNGKGNHAAFFTSEMKFVTSVGCVFAGGINRPLNVADGSTQMDHPANGTWVIPDDAKWFSVGSFYGTSIEKPNVNIVFEKKGDLDNFIKGEHLDTEEELSAFIMPDDASDTHAPSSKSLLRIKNTLDDNIKEVHDRVFGRHNEEVDLTDAERSDFWVYPSNDVNNTTFKYQDGSKNGLIIDIRKYVGKTLQLSYQLEDQVFVGVAFLTHKNLKANTADGILSIDGELQASSSKIGAKYHIVTGLGINPFVVPEGAVYMFINTYSYSYSPLKTRVSLFDPINIDGLVEAGTFLNKGAKIAVFGGSWAYYAALRGGIDIWKKMLITDKIDDYAIGGAGFGINNHLGEDGKSIPQQVDEATAEDKEAYDVYVLWASTNDFLTFPGTAVGTADSYTEVDGYSEDALKTQCGGINYCIKKIAEKNPKAQIVFFTSAPAFAGSSYYDERKGFKAFIDGQIACCNRFHIPIFDQWRIGLNEYNYTPYFVSDKLHMNQSGYTRLGYKQAEWLRNCIG